MPEESPSFIEAESANRAQFYRDIAATPFATPSHRCRLSPACRKKCTAATCDHVKRIERIARIAQFRPSRQGP